MLENSQVITTSNNQQLITLLNNVLPIGLILKISNNQEELFRQLIENPGLCSVIIMPPLANNLNLLRQLNSCSKTKTIPVIMELTEPISLTDIDIYIKSGAHYCLPNDLEFNTVKTILSAAIYDRKRYLAIEQDILAEHAASVMDNAEFKLQTLKDCQSVANLIANACPNPNLAVIGIAEILINAVEHGNLGISYAEKTKLQKTANWSDEVTRRINLPENKDKYVTVQFQKNNDHLKLYVRDEGPGFDWNKFQYLDAKRIYDSHGRGIVMAKNLAFERLEYLNKGNEVNCYINLAAI